MKKVPPSPRNTVSIKQLRDRALRALLPRMVEDIIDTRKEGLEQYHYLLQCHLETWINAKEVQVVDEKGKEVLNVPAALVKEIWELKNA